MSKNPGITHAFLESFSDVSVGLDRARQVFCNRDLNLAKVTAVGFDMDYTLARYHQSALEDLSFRLTLERLVRERGYPSEILGIEARHNFALRGLVVDTWKGNVLKIDAHRYVGKGYHGFKELSDDARKAYRDETIRLNDNSRYALIDTLFALPEVTLYAALVDYLETTEPNVEHDWRKLYADIRFCIDLAHRDGGIKTEIMANMGDYIHGHDTQLAQTLHKMRSSGKQLFLITNSFSVYSHHVMTHLLEGVLDQYPHWQSYFDIIVTGARKPTFFTERAPFMVVDEHGAVHGDEHATLSRNVIYQGGNLLDFERMAGISGEKIVYVGDHIHGDIVRSKKSSAWRTVMIVEELELELSRAQILREDVMRIDATDAEIFRTAEQLSFKQHMLHQLEAAFEKDADPQLAEVRKTLLLERDQLKRRRRELLVELENLEHELAKAFNPYWGLIFREGNENTLFGAQVEDYACLYTSHVSNLLNYSPLHYFRTPRQMMPHERY